MYFQEPRWFSKNFLSTWSFVLDTRFYEINLPPLLINGINQDFLKFRSTVRVLNCRE